LGYSTKAIFITIVISSALALIPIILALTKLPGDGMVLAANDSAVISAACHCIPVETAVELTEVESMASRRRLLGDDQSRREAARSSGSSMAEEVEGEQGKDRNRRLLAQMTIQKLKWGVVARGQTPCTKEHPGHLAIGTMDQDVEPPVVGHFYAGTGKNKLE
jgi:hypothetical protein